MDHCSLHITGYYGICGNFFGGADLETVGIGVQSVFLDLGNSALVLDHFKTSFGCTCAQPRFEMYQIAYFTEQ